MSYPADSVKAGMDVLQDVDPKMQIPRMAVRYGCRVLERDDYEDLIVDKDTVGDQRGWVWWANVPERRPNPAWAHAWASRVASSANGYQFGILPISDRFDYDERWGVKIPTAPRIAPGNQYPLWNRMARGTVGITLLNTNEHETADLFMPTDPRIVAPNEAGDFLMGTVVSDLNASNVHDHSRYARVHTAWRVVPMGEMMGGLPGAVPDPFNANWRLGALAWNLALTGGEAALGRGLVIDQRSGAVPTPPPVPSTDDRPPTPSIDERRPPTPAPPSPPPGAPGSGK